VAAPGAPLPLRPSGARPRGPRTGRLPPGSRSSVGRKRPPLASPSSASPFPWESMPRSISQDPRESRIEPTPLAVEGGGAPGVTPRGDRPELIPTTPVREAWSPVVRSLGPRTVGTGPDRGGSTSAWSRPTSPAPRGGDGSHPRGGVPGSTTCFPWPSPIASSRWPPATPRTWMPSAPWGLPRGGPWSSGWPPPRRSRRPWTPASPRIARWRGSWGTWSGPRSPRGPPGGGGGWTRVPVRGGRGERPGDEAHEPHPPGRHRRRGVGHPCGAGARAGGGALPGGRGAPKSHGACP
jgi:hypothetical protein